MKQPACFLSPYKDDDPYFLDARLFRSDIRSNPSDGVLQAGAPLRLTIHIMRADGERDPVEGALVDIWQCNAHGMYSGVHDYRTVGKMYLRGCQTTDATGEVRFTTIIPGFYWNRTVHIHFKIRLFDERNDGYEFTSQLFFDQDFVEELHRTRIPYSLRGEPSVKNDEDDIYRERGADLSLALAADDRDGYSGSIALGLLGLPSPVSD